MNLNILKPRKALNKAFLKVKANRNEIELFKTNLISLLDNINESESEEFHKNLVSKFLTDTYYGTNHFINTKGRNDLVINNTNSASGTVGVIIEAKKPTNKFEMPKTGNINVKAFQELVLYYLRERITENNLEIKNLVATNINEWFIFDANLFEKEFAQNKAIVKQFRDFEEGRLSGKTTDFFYKNIAEPAIDAIKHEIDFTYFDIREYEKPLRNSDKADDNSLITLYKLLSPEHLLKLPFANDSNSLDKTFYTELLHIIGLAETKDGSKKIIDRKKAEERNTASLIESAIIQLDSLDKISRLEKGYLFGETKQERLLNVALELAITWINRILFLKLLEAQLIKYHKGDKSFAFLNLEKVKNFDDLNSLFFSVLAKRPDERNDDVKKLFSKVPYLNSSLFEPTNIEHSCLFISQLKDGKIPILNSTVIKDNNGIKRSGELYTLEYLFEFLNAYDFSSEGSESIQEENKTLINASVLGLIFEKINGYKDGSFFTPGSITMYMSRETIRQAVLKKFNDKKKWNCLNFEELYNKIEDKREANIIINDLKICDPAVGSGHFLVSALNEIISIKNDLKILIDKQGKTLRDYYVEVENDELVITDDDGNLFEYNPNNKESQRIQETLFHEKQNIIENCLFGVDINPNSVKICRLRLWIELLKNAYYKEGNSIELETLPNIDINIKCGNSLISRYSLDVDIRKALKSTNWSIDGYRKAIMSYRNAQSKDEKREMEVLIEKIKNDFESEIAANDKRLIRLRKLKGDLQTLTSQTSIFELSKTEKALKEKQIKTLIETIKKLQENLEEIKNNKAFEGAFEWRFEFPEILDDEGAFIGFDLIIGNPPYGVKLSEKHCNILKEQLFNSSETAILFIYKGRQLLNEKGFQSYIIPKAFTYSSNYSEIRELLKDELMLIVDCHKPWQEVKLEACIFQIQKQRKIDNYNSLTIKDNSFIKLTDTSKSLIDEFGFFLNGISDIEIGLAQKIKMNNLFFGDISINRRGVGIQQKILREGTYPVLGGIDIERNAIRDTQRGFINDISSIENIGRIQENSALVQNIVAHLTNPVGHVKIIAALPPTSFENYVILDTINQFTFDSKVSNVFGCFLLNSKLINWYVYNFIYAKAIRTMHFDNVVTNRIPFPKAYFDNKKTIDNSKSTLSDNLIYQLFGLNEIEISIIESTF